MKVRRVDNLTLHEYDLIDIKRVSGLFFLINSTYHNPVFRRRRLVLRNLKLKYNN